MTVDVQRCARAVLLALVALAVGGCVTPISKGRHPSDLELSTALSVGPGVGATVGFAQRFAGGDDGVRYDLVFDVTRQQVDDGTLPSGDVDDSLALVRWGVRASYVGWRVRVGGVWVRSQGDADSFEAGRDYAGAHVALGYEWSIATGVTSGPEFGAHYADAEGSGRPGYETEIAWRVSWGL